MKRNIRESVNLLTPILVSVFKEYIKINVDKEENLIEMVSLAMNIGTSFLFTITNMIARQNIECLNAMEKIQNGIQKIILDSDIFVKDVAKDKH